MEVRPETAEAVVERYLERHAACDLEGVMSLFAANAVLEDPVGSAPRRGVVAIRAFYAETHARNGRLEIERVGPALCGGSEVAAHIRARFAGPADAPWVDVIYTLTLDPAGAILTLRAYFAL